MTTQELQVALYSMPDDEEHERMKTDKFFRAGAIMYWFDINKDIIRQLLEAELKKVNG